MESTNQICSHIFPCFQYFPAMFSSHVSNIFQPCFPMFPYFPMFPMFPYCSHQNGPPNTSKPVQRIMTNGPLCQAGISDMRGIWGPKKTLCLLVYKPIYSNYSYLRTINHSYCTYKPTQLSCEESHYTYIYIYIYIYSVSILCVNVKRNIYCNCHDFPF